MLHCDNVDWALNKKQEAQEPGPCILLCIGVMVSGVS
jgi:hypothetical protein